jgi:hypothetical protein
MVFVHARKDTVKTAQTLREKALAEGLADLFDPNVSSSGEDIGSKWQGFKRDLASSRNREMKELAAGGFGCVFLILRLHSRSNELTLVFLSSQNPSCWNASVGPQHGRADV